MKKKGLSLVIAFFVFIAVFTGIFFFHKQAASAGYLAAAEQSFGLSTFGGSLEETEELFSTYGALGGLVLGCISLVTSLLAYVLLKAVKLPMNISAIVAGLVGYGPWLAFGIELVYFEDQLVAWANGIIFYLGTPMIYASAVACLATIVLALIPSKTS